MQSKNQRIKEDKKMGKELKDKYINEIYFNIIKAIIIIAYIYNFF